MDNVVGGHSSETEIQLTPVSSQLTVTVSETKLNVKLKLIFSTFNLE